MSDQDALEVLQAAVRRAAMPAQPPAGPDPQPGRAAAPNVRPPIVPMPLVPLPGPGPSGAYVPGGDRDPDTSFSKAPADNDIFFKEWLKSDAFYTNLYLRNINLPPMTGSWDDPLIPSMAYFASLGRRLVLNRQARMEDSIIRATTCAELLGPALPETFFLPTEAARSMLIRAVRELLAHMRLSVMSRGNRENYHEFMELHPTLAGTPLPDDYDMYETDPQIAMRLLGCIAAGALSIYSVSGVSIITHIIVAVCKRGIVSQEFLEKISTGIRDDLSLDVILDEATIALFFKQFGKNIDENSVGAILTRWGSRLPGGAMRLSLTIQQTSGSGLTSLKTIGKAITSFPDFPWWHICALFPGEWNSFRIAVAKVGTNAYYGFSKDLMEVRSTKYKSLAWIAKELLAKIGGDRRIGAYKGWPSRIAHQPTVDGLIADYEARRGAAAINQHDPRLVADTKAVVDLVEANAAMYT